MYLIANPGKHEVIISDINLILGPKQAIDLHKIKTISEVEKSKDLKNAIAKRMIKLLHKEGPKEQPIKTEVIVHNDFNKEELLKDIKKILSEEVDKKINKANSQKNEEFLEMLRSIQKSINTSPTGEKNIVEEDEIKSDKIVEIHAKALNKMSKNVDVSMTTDVKKVEDKSVSNNADELNKLI